MAWSAASRLVSLLPVHLYGEDLSAACNGDIACCVPDIHVPCSSRKMVVALFKPQIPTSR